MPTTLHRVWHGDGVQAGGTKCQFAKAVAKALSRFGYYHLEVSELKSLGTGQISDRIGYYGENLADFIAWTKSDPEGTAIYETILPRCGSCSPRWNQLLSRRPDQTNRVWHSTSGTTGLHNSTGYERRNHVYPWHALHLKRAPQAGGSVHRRARNRTASSSSPMANRKICRSRLSANGAGTRPKSCSRRTRHLSSIFSKICSPQSRW